MAQRRWELLRADHLESILRCVLAHALKAVEQGALGFIDLVAGYCQIEPFSAVDFGESLLAAASWRPFDLESVALNCPYIQVEIGGESLDDLAASIQSEFFSKFPSSRAFCDFVSGKFAFRNRPRTEVLVAPKRSSRMNQKYLKPASVPSDARMPALLEGMIVTSGNVRSSWSARYRAPNRKPIVRRG